MLLSVSLGALLYMFIQFLWYSPIGFGKEWLRMKHETPKSIVEGLSVPDLVPKSLLGIVAPAFLMSAAVHLLGLMFLPLGLGIFWGAVGSMWFLTALPKYRTWSKLEGNERSLFFLTDGALLASLLSLGWFVMWAEGKVY